MSISEEELNAVTGRIDAWASKALKQFDTITAEHRQETETLKENLSSLAQDQATVQAQLAKRGQEVADTQKLAASLKDQLDSLTVTQQALPGSRDDILRTMTGERNSVATLEKSLDEQRELSTRRGAELAKGTAMYRKWLGLAFERVGEDRLRLDLTHVDPSQPGRTFSFEVYVDSTNAYHVDSCNPSVAGLPALLARLNETNNFAEFVRALRRKFQESVPGRDGGPPTLTQA